MSGVTPVVLGEVPAGWSDPLFDRDSVTLLLGQEGHVLLGMGADAEAGHLLLRLNEGAMGDILTLWVPEDFRRRGYARELLAAGIVYGRAMGCTGIAMEVREGNAPARTLYEACGFGVIGKRDGYYHDPVEDALIYGMEFPR